MHHFSKPWHRTPASSAWPLEQLTVELREQSIRLVSLPVQPTLSRYISPVPAPKWALLKATASVDSMSQYMNVKLMKAWYHLHCIKYTLLRTSSLWHKITSKLWYGYWQLQLCIHSLLCCGNSILHMKFLQGSILQSSKVLLIEIFGFNFWNSWQCNTCCVLYSTHFSFQPCECRLNHMQKIFHCKNFNIHFYPLWSSNDVSSMRGKIFKYLVAIVLVIVSWLMSS